MKKRNILIVDDYEDNRLLLSNIADILGCDYQVAANGVEALESIKKNDFDLVLMDIEMPLMNGFDVIDEVRNNFWGPKRDIIIVAITAHSPAHFTEKFKEVKFNDFVAKPYTVDKVEAIFNKYFG